MTTHEFLKAAFEGQQFKVRAGVDQGMDVNVQDQDGQSALMLAAYNGHTKLVQFLLNPDNFCRQRTQSGDGGIIAGLPGKPRPRR